MAFPVTCPCGNTFSLEGDSGRCANCNCEIEVYPSIEVARTTAEFRENARVCPVPETAMWMVAIG